MDVVDRCDLKWTVLEEVRHLLSATKFCLRTIKECVSDDRSICARVGAGTVRQSSSVTQPCPPDSLRSSISLNLELMFQVGWLARSCPGPPVASCIHWVTVHFCTCFPGITLPYQLNHPPLQCHGIVMIFKKRQWGGGPQ